MNIKCCKDCKKRCVGCHATCEDYIRERHELDEYNRRLREEKRNQQPMPKSFR